MDSFNPIETAQVVATTENLSVEFSDPASISAPDLMLDNEGIYTVYVAVGKNAVVPTELPISGSVPVLPTSTKYITKGSGVKISVITANGSSKINITPGQKT